MTPARTNGFTVNRMAGEGETRRKSRTTTKVSRRLRAGKWLAEAFVATAIIAACNGGSSPIGPPAASLATCAPGTAVFTVPPVALNGVMGWVPLGNLNPPGHTFPTDHQYLYLAPNSAAVD